MIFEILIGFEILLHPPCMKNDTVTFLDFNSTQSRLPKLNLSVKDVHNLNQVTLRYKALRRQTTSIHDVNMSAKVMKPFELFSCLA